MKIVSCTKITKLLSKNDLVLEETSKNSVIPSVVRARKVFRWLAREHNLPSVILLNLCE